MSRARPPRDPALDHWNYDELAGTDTSSPCGCRLCSTHREARRDADAAPAIPEGHGHQCTCVTCRERRRLSNHLVCVSNQRDLYSEMSFILQGVRRREEILTWLLREIRSPRRRPYFWIHTTEGKPLASWIEDWWEAQTNARESCDRVLTQLQVP